MVDAQKSIARTGEKVADSAVQIERSTKELRHRPSASRILPTAAQFSLVTALFSRQSGPMPRGCARAWSLSRAASELRNC
jgi:hypothetical protein